MGCRGREVRRPLGVSAGRAARSAGRRRSEPDRRVHPGAPRPRGTQALARSRPPHADSPRLARSHRHSADARGDRRIRQRQVARRVREAGGPPDGHRRAMPSSRRCTGSTPSATPILAAFTATTRCPPGHIAITCCTPSATTSRSTSSRASNSRATCIPDATVEQRVASAYNRLNRTSAEGGLQPKEYLAKYAADRVRTTVAVWMGSTLGCAECHDHKFDPFTSRDFYSMKAFFADIKETGLVPDRGKDAWGTQLSIPSPEQAAAAGGAESARRGSSRAADRENGGTRAEARRMGEAPARAIRSRRAGLAVPASDLRRSRERRGAEDLQRRARRLHALRRKHDDGRPRPETA